MCGRFTLATPPAELAERFELSEAPVLAPRFNVAPGQDVAIVRTEPGKSRVFELRRWGLVPAWADDPRSGFKMINARAETAAERPAYRDAFRRRRCLIPADGFYEWASGPAPRQPYYLKLRDGGVFGMAGLYERWRDPDGGVLESCAVLTTEANPMVRPIHDRMPVILGAADHALWLDPDANDPESLRPLLSPAAADVLVAHPVSHRVNDTGRDDPHCVEPVPEPLPPML